MNTLDIGDILEEWNLSHLYTKFKDERITIEVLKILSPIPIAKLFSDLPVGDQAIFETNLKKWMQSLETSDVDLSTSTNVTQKIICSVKEILKTTYNGQEIYAFYKKNGKLYDEQRNLLISTITKYIESHGIDCSLSECTELEKEICSLFPTEEMEFYTNGKRGNKLANHKRVAKDTFKCKNQIPDKIENDVEDNYDLILMYLRDEKTTAEDFCLYWKQCAPLRFKQMKDSKKTSEILKLWPEFKKPSAWQLIDVDFKIKFPNAKNLFERWSQLGDKMLTLLKQKVSSAFVSQKLLELDAHNEESKTFAVLWYLHYIFPPNQKVNTDPSGSKIRKKFSIADSQNGFAILADSSQELETKIKLLQLQNRCIQPKLLIVGQFPSIKSINIYLDNIRYPFCNILKAFDILFKLFFVFNLQYPEESELFYNFIQNCFYDIPLQKKSTKI
ncbi:uncharacterized protein LOC119609869 isoform X1 [Lucilia sericata]|uniref:uncharacterized protein LOC119609869 isoform X1 n=2 Tax=Lucilia sericata TaxID=13632 RepID=UPI0018A81A1B|nr:uncharacterized protein LOC119609869 isoform X1 [Lucilia sericata]